MRLGSGLRKISGPMGMPEQRFECPTCRAATLHRYRVTYLESVGRRVAAWTCARCGDVNPQQLGKGPNGVDEGTSRPQDPPSGPAGV